MTALERWAGALAVLAIHLGLVAWITTSFGQTPPVVVPPTIQGVLVPAEAPTPPQPLPVAPEPVPPPEPAPPEPPPLPEPPPPEPPPPEPPKPEPKPQPKPRPKPPSDKAITVPEAPREPAPPPPVAPSAAAPAEAVKRPAQPPSGPPGPPAEAPVVPPRVDAAHLNNPAPQYPSVSRRLGEQGQVLLDVHILPDGSVGEVRLRQTSGHRRLDDAAIAAVQRWRYVPARRGDTAIAYWYVQPIVFSLSR